MSRVQSLAVAQTIPVRGDVDANLRRHLEAADAAAQAGARILVFPELSLTGYELDLADGLAFARDDARLDPLTGLARTASMALVVGAPVRLDTGLHIGAFLIGADGSLDVYTKRHLGAFGPEARADGRVPPAEATVFRPGPRDPLLRAGGGTAAVAVCADTGRASHWEGAADRGADAYLAGMFVIPSAFDEEAGSLEAGAARHGLAVAFANYGGPSGGLDAAGRSTVWSETGRRLARLDPTGAGVAVAIREGDGWRTRVVTLPGH